MPFQIRMGVPEMEAHWNDLVARRQAHSIGADEVSYFKKLVKTLAHLATNPRHPGLQSHEIDELTH